MHSCLWCDVPGWELFSQGTVRWLCVFMKNQYMVVADSIRYLVFSLAGVVLIARPPFIFGTSGEELEILVKEVTPEQRLIAVGYVASLAISIQFSWPTYRVALIGVLGATGACEPSFIQSNFFRPMWFIIDTSLRAIGKRAHPLHSLVMFSFYSVVVASIGWGLCKSFKYRLPNSCSRMIVTKTPLVVPTRPEWLGMLFIIGIFGFFAQVGARSILCPSFDHHISSRYS